VSNRDTASVKASVKASDKASEEAMVNAPDPSSAPTRGARQDRARQTYRRLMDAAAKVVGDEGYAGASIAKIVAKANMATGTFYNHFDDRQALFDALLPHIGHELVDHISLALREQGDAAASGPEREVARFRAFCDYLCDHPGFYRILYEAEVFAPRAHAEHIRRLVDGYRRSLGRSAERGELKGYSPEELETVALLLLGARSYIAMKYIVGGDKTSRGKRRRGRPVPEAVISAYGRLISGGLLGRAG